jgi:hypothetical protein
MQHLSQGMNALHLRTLLVGIALIVGTVAPAAAEAAGSLNGYRG